VLTEIDEMAKATLKSITLATLLRLSQQKADITEQSVEGRSSQ
jgi:hypothetical protein